MIKNLVKHGNSWALVIDRPILDLLKISPDAPLELTTDGRSITVVPVSSLDQKIGSPDQKRRVRAARKKVNAKYSKAFRKLAE